MFLHPILDLLRSMMFYAYFPGSLQEILHVMNLCMYVCMHACMHLSIYLSMHVCMYACMHVCMYVCMFVCLYTKPPTMINKTQQPSPKAELTEDIVKYVSMHVQVHTI